MMASDVMPAQEEFMTAERDVVANYAPRSMVYAPGGTRRSATFAGIKPGSAEYFRLGQREMILCLETIFHYGVEHVFTPAVMVGHVNEFSNIEQELIVPMARFVTDPDFVGDCRKRGWRVQIASSSYQEVLQPYVELLSQTFDFSARHTWWMTFTPSIESWWANVISLAKSAAVTTHADLIRTLYGEDIPPITLCIAFGKPMISPDLFPPLLMDNVECYWSQQAGYTLSDRQFRKVLYDYAYLRRTWQKDKTARAKEAQRHRDIWEREFILGLGKRLGPFWYPDVPEKLAAESEQGA